MNESSGAWCLQFMLERRLIKRTPAIKKREALVVKLEKRKQVLSRELDDRSPFSFKKIPRLLMNLLLMRIQILLQV